MQLSLFSLATKSLVKSTRVGNNDTIFGLSATKGDNGDSVEVVTASSSPTQYLLPSLEPRSYSKQDDDRSDVIGQPIQLLVCERRQDGAPSAVLSASGGRDTTALNVQFFRQGKKSIFFGAAMSVSPLGKGPLVACNDSGHIAIIAKKTGSLVTFQSLDPSSKRTLKLPFNRPTTVLAMHPTESVVALGDSSGRIAIVRRVQRGDGREESEGQLAVSYAHWHSLPVAALAWSEDGEHLYSGGGEAVVVKWSAAHLQKVSLAPRLGGPIVGLSASASVVVVSFNDGRVRCFSHQLEMVAAFSVAHILPSLGGELFWHRPTATIAYQRYVYNVWSLLRT